MRVAVVGASGNVGTAVLRALAAEPAVSGVVGIARRVPDRARAPYDGVDWYSADIALHDGAAVHERLVDAFTGADAVVHLVWAIQPNKKRDYLRRVNVDGTRRVAEAAAHAGVAHLVVASSLAVYSPVEDDVPRTETARRGGIASSHYSVDKAAQERVLDEVELQYPELAIARMRPALIFQGDAGAQIVRYFLGPFLPTALMRERALPALPIPTGLRLQVVHADDVARAYLAVVMQRATGAFNVASADVLRPAQLARILDHGQYVEIPPATIRPLLHTAWRAGLVAADAGWLDMAMGVPVMDTSRIRGLGWSEEHTAEHALRELLAGMREHRGTLSPSLRPDDSRFGSRIESALPPADRAAATDRRGGFTALPMAARSAQIPEGVDAGLLGLYLSDHLTGATAGTERIQRMADDFAETPLGPELAIISEEIAAERELLRELLVVLGLNRRVHRQAAAWLAERAGRLKLNGRLAASSPLTPLLELELMRSAVNGKLGLWQTLHVTAPDLGIPAEPFADLADLARSQAARLESLHGLVRRSSFTGEPINEA